MNDVLQDKLKALNEDKFLVQALRELFDARAEKERPDPETLEDNVMLGEKYRAYTMAKKIIFEAFNDLKGYEFNNKENLTYNKGK